MVALCDGATLAHMGDPDMRVPIAYALHHPERVDVPVPMLDLTQVGSLTFEAPDLEAFPASRSPSPPPARAAPRPASSTPPTRSPCTRSSTSASASSASPR